MKWPFRHTRQPSDVEGIEMAKLALEIAQQIEMHATESEKIHADILRRNNFGPKIHRALGGQ